MDNRQDIIHRLLDGDLPAREREELLGRIEADPALLREYEALADAVALLGREGMREAPAGFTRQVMQRLPEPSLPPAARLRDFLFRGRVLQWNMAALFAVVALVAVVAVVGLRQQQEGGRREQAVTVRLNFYAPQAGRVAVAGDFNRWQGDSTPMTRQEGGVWTVDITVRPGVYAYMFVVDGTDWVADPDAETFQDDGFGSRNAVVRVET